MRTRREFLGATALTLGGLAGVRSGQARAETRPNVVLIITDDQGYGDLGCHGNTAIRTPNLDRLHGESARIDRFYVCPVCSPTRASLMTGRYNYRTGVVDTFSGRSMMHGDEVTLAEMLGAAGYKTGIFGKWHLGDNFPMRAIDQGFQEALVHNGGGVGQPSDPPGNKYHDPILSHNGKQKPFKGYCTDIFTEAAMAFIEANRSAPFFAYLSTNAPHTPLQIDDKYAAPYLAMGLDETTAKIYGMVENIDENIGKLLRKLDELALTQNTIVIFMTDNGPQQERYNAGMRGLKTTIYEGGIRVPCFVRWPARLRAGHVVKPIAAHIDIAPTLLAACGAAAPAGVQFDGRNILPLLLEEDAAWPERTLFTQWHRGDEPERFRSCAAITQRYKLVDGKELYDLETDPAESNDIAAEHPEIVERLRKEYDAWFDSVSASRGYAPPRIYLGAPEDNPTTLTRQDWRGAAGWGDKDIGYWEVFVTRDGDYQIDFRFAGQPAGAIARLRIGGVMREQALEAGAVSCRFENVPLSAGPARLHAELLAAQTAAGVRYVGVKL